MRRCVQTLIAVLVLFVVAEPALAHHLMGGKTPSTFAEGLLSGLGHPLIGIDHFAAVVAVGALAAGQRLGPALAISFVLAMMLGVAAHLNGTTVPAAELLVALTVIGLGAVLLLTRRPLATPTALCLFALVGLIHGYALGESIYGAERSPLVAYLAGLAVIQGAVALGAMALTRLALARAETAMPRLIGAGVAGVGLAVLMQQVVPAA